MEQRHGKVVCHTCNIITGSTFNSFLFRNLLHVTWQMVYLQYILIQCLNQIGHFCFFLFCLRISVHVIKHKFMYLMIRLSYHFIHFDIDVYAVFN